MFSTTSTIDEVILKALSQYVRGRADEIVAKHTNEAIVEIERAVREEVSKTVLEIGKFVSFERMGTEIIIKISDSRNSPTPKGE